MNRILKSKGGYVKIKVEVMSDPIPKYVTNLDNWTVFTARGPDNKYLVKIGSKVVELEVLNTLVTDLPLHILLLCIIDKSRIIKDMQVGKIVGTLKMEEV